MKEPERASIDQADGPPNAALKLTRPGEDGAAQLNAVFDAYSVAIDSEGKQMVTTWGGFFLLAGFMLVLFLVPVGAAALAMFIAFSGRRWSTQEQSVAHETGVLDPQAPRSARPLPIGWRRWVHLGFGFTGAAVGCGSWLYRVHRAGRLDVGGDLFLGVVALMAGLGFFGGALAGWIFFVFHDGIAARSTR